MCLHESVLAFLRCSWQENTFAAPPSCLAADMHWSSRQTGVYMGSDFLFPKDMGFCQQLGFLDTLSVLASLCYIASVLFSSLLLIEKITCSGNLVSPH